MGSRQSSSVVANESSSSSSGSDDYAATGRRKRQAILERRNEFPARLQRAIREAETRYPAPRQHAKFLRSVRDLLADWVFEAAIVTTTTNDLSDTHDDAGGPHDERDTEAQVEVALRFFPTVLGLRRYGLFPILWLSRSIHSVSFIPLFARLGTEIGSFPANERGGLVFGKSHTVFAQLAAATCCGGANAEETPFCRQAESAPSRHALVDAKFLRVIQRLREENLMIRSDIRTYKMIDVLCHQPIFPERRFRYLMDWDPALLLSNQGRETKSSLSLRLIKRFFDPDDIAGFELLFDLSMKHYPADLGFLFDTVYVVDEDRGRIKRKKPKTTAGTTTQDAEGESSQHSRSSSSCTHKSCETTDDEDDEPATSLFQTACDTYGKDKVQTILDGALYGQMVRDANFTKKALLATATVSSNEPQKQPEQHAGEKKDRAQAIYMLLQRDPRDLRRLSLEFATPQPVRRRSYLATAA